MGALVIVTIYYAIKTGKMVEEMKNARKEQARRTHCKNLQAIKKEANRTNPMKVSTSLS